MFHKLLFLLLLLITPVVLIIVGACPVPTSQGVLVFRGNDLSQNFHRSCFLFIKYLKFTSFSDSAIAPMVSFTTLGGQDKNKNKNEINQNCSFEFEIIMAFSHGRPGAIVQVSTRSWEGMVAIKKDLFSF